MATMDTRRLNFFISAILTLPLWVVFFLLMTAWDIADNFRGQMNAGHRKLMKKGELTDVV